MSRVPCAPPGKSGAAAVAAAVERGLVVHVEHPNFPCVLTAGLSRRADGSRVYEIVAHGARCAFAGDIESTEGSALELGRALEAQVGNRRAYWAAMAAAEVA